MSFVFLQKLKIVYDAIQYTYIKCGVIFQIKAFNTFLLNNFVKIYTLPPQY